MKRQFLGLILSIVPIFVFSQNMTKKETIEDFDYLYHSIIKTSITTDIFCKDYGISFEDEYKKIRESLSENPSFENFIISSQRLFNISGDMHNFFETGKSLSSLIPFLPENEKKATLERIDTSNLATSDRNYFQAQNILQQNRSCLNRIKTRYFQGEYFVLYDTKIDDVKIPYGSIIQEVNGIKFEKFINQDVSNFFLKKEKFTNTFYTDNLFFGVFKSTDSISLRFRTGDNVEINTVVTENSEITYRYPFLTLNYLNNIQYIKEHKLLYISYTFLHNTDKLIPKLEKYKKQAIEKIVIDLRGNFGGSDLEWIKLLNYLSDKLIFKENAYLHIKQDELIFKHFSLADKTVDYLNNDILEYIKPDNNGFKYSKDFYLIIDNKTFSSALAFANTSAYCERIKLIGFETPYYGGFGATPLYFMLPNSKLVYRISSTFDKKLYQTDTKTLQFDIRVDPSIEEELDFINKKIRNYKTKKYIVTDNIFLKAVIEDKE